MADRSNGGSGFSWFLAGLGIGSLLGVLYAPRPGQETREELIANALGTQDYLKQRSREATQAAGEYLERGKGQAAEYANRGKSQVNQYVSTGKDQVDQYVSKGKDAVEASKQKVTDAYSQSVQALADQKEKLAAAYEAGKQAYVETPGSSAPQGS